MDDYTDSNWTAYALMNQLNHIHTQSIVTPNGVVVLDEKEVELLKEFLQDILLEREIR